METVETWLFDLLMFAQGKAQPDVSDDVNRFYRPALGGGGGGGGGGGCPRTLKTAPKGKRFAWSQGTSHMKYLLLSRVQPL